MFRVLQYLGKPIFTTLCGFLELKFIIFTIFYLYSKLIQLTNL